MNSRQRRRLVRATKEERMLDIVTRRLEGRPVWEEWLATRGIYTQAFGKYSHILYIRARAKAEKEREELHVLLTNQTIDKEST